MTNKEKQIIKNQIKHAKSLQWNASQMRDAAGVFRMQKVLEALYQKLDDANKPGEIIGYTLPLETLLAHAKQVV